MLSSVTPCTSHTAFIKNQNWFGSSFHTPLNTGNFIPLAILTCDGGTDEDGGEDGEAGGGAGGGGMHGILYLIKLISLLGEAFASSSSSPRGGEIKGLVSSYALFLFL